ncbi:MAG: hypothetical protein PHV33_05395 [Elusimicrobiales bacterium]|nr:hypothetical protein [Elusimicrobiales bacterium]
MAIAIDTPPEYVKVEDSTMYAGQFNLKTANQTRKPDVNLTGGGGSSDSGSLLWGEKEVAFGEGEIVGFESDIVKLLIVESNGRQEIYNVPKSLMSEWGDPSTIAEGARYRASLIEKDGKQKMRLVGFPAPFVSSKENIIPRVKIDEDIKKLRDILGK